MSRFSFVIAFLIAAVAGPPGSVASAQQLVSISGRALDPLGRPVSVEIQVVADPSAPAVAKAPAESDGTFSLSVPAGLYTVMTGVVAAPFLRTQVSVDARNGNVRDLLLRVSPQTPPIPDDPPRGSLIGVSLPNEAGDVVVTGAPGAVAPNSYLMLVTIDTGHAISTRANADGSFSASLFAPFGSSILVKADPFGSVLSRLRDQVNLPQLSLMAGTIVRVAEPVIAGPGVSFGRSGTVNGERPENPANHPLVWSFEGTLASQAISPGETVRIEGTLRIISSTLANAGLMQVDEGASVTLDLVSGADGRGALAQNTFASTLMTPTGLPIERERNGATVLGDSIGTRIDLVKTAPDRAETRLQFAIVVPEDAPDGFYVPVMRLHFWGVPLVESPPSRVMIVTDKIRSQAVTYLPVIRVGAPAPGRLPAALLADRLSNGTLGGRAREDFERFALSSRMRMNDRIIVPRVDALGQPMKYRLEPFLPTIGLTDAGSANMPLIPLRFPSGHLTVRVDAPDGSSRVIGPAPFVQPALRSNGFAGSAFRDLNYSYGATTEITECYRLTTLDPRYEVEFGSDGVHVITLDGEIADLWGNTWIIRGTFDVHVARPLSVNAAIIPGTPFDVGDRMSTVVSVTPPVPADVELRLRLLPASDPARIIDRTVRGRADRFGYFNAAGTVLPLSEPGEYRVDIVASFVDEEGNALEGGRTWGSVVAPRDTPIIAHGRRGEINSTNLGQAWFVRSQTPIPKSGHPSPPFHAGDVFWGKKSDNSFVIFTMQDPAGRVTDLLRARRAGSRAGVLGPGTFDERAVIGEVPLFCSRPDDLDPHIDPSRVDLWGYTYRFVERPGLAVREYIAEDQVGHGYWRFNDEAYAGQAGAGHGDLPNDFKFFFGGVVLRGPALGESLYAPYASLLVIVPDDDPHGGMRVFPPFRGNGDGPDGGPLLELKGEEINLFLHLTGVLPGTVLQVGETVTFAGYSAPSLPSRVEILVTSPSGVTHTIHGRANRSGYFYDPAGDFTASEAGVWRAKVKITFDGILPSTNGQVIEPFPTGDVLGSHEGEFNFYVVRRDAEPLSVNVTGTEILAGYLRQVDTPLTFTVDVPAGLTNVEMYTTTTMPGFLLEERRITSDARSLTYVYDATALARDFPNLDLRTHGVSGFDTITISFLLTGTDSAGARRSFARQVVIQGEELQMPAQRPRQKRRAVR